MTDNRDKRPNPDKPEADKPEIDRPLRDGSRDAHTIDPAMIERIEVIHGANALQGLGASGGIINIITKRAPREDGDTWHDLSLGASTALPTPPAAECTKMVCPARRFASS